MFNHWGFSITQEIILISMPYLKKIPKNAKITVRSLSLHTIPPFYYMCIYTYIYIHTHNITDVTFFLLSSSHRMVKDDCHTGDMQAVVP